MIKFMYTQYKCKTHKMKDLEKAITILNQLCHRVVYKTWLGVSYAV